MWVEFPQLFEIIFSDKEITYKRTAHPHSQVRNELGHSISYKISSSLSEDSDQPLPLPKEALGPWLPTKCTAKTLIRLCRCAD